MAVHPDTFAATFDAVESRIPGPFSVIAKLARGLFQT